MKRLLFSSLVLGLMILTLNAGVSFTNKKLIAADLTVAINSTVVDGAGLTSEKPIIAYADAVSLIFYVKGNNAGCSAGVIFKFAAYDSIRQQWDTIEFLSQTVAANGTEVVQQTILLNPGAEKIKLLSVQNQETVAGYTVDVNVTIFIRSN